MYEWPLIIVADLEGPIARGHITERERLYRALTRRPNCILIYLTHRYIESARAFQELMYLPRPHFFVTDTGASVAPGRGDRSIAVVDRELDRNWPGSPEILTRLEALDHLMDTHPLEAPRRVSFVTRDGVTTQDVVPKAEQLLKRLDVQVVAEDPVHLDVVPRGVSPKRTLDRVLSWIDLDRQWEVLVVVGSADEMQLVDDNSRAIVVAAPDDRWAQAAAQRPRAHRAARDGCAGIYDAAVELGLLDPQD
jgi:hypothetical protein